MAKKLEGKVAIVTGGGRGIGRGISLLMGAEGASVVVNDLFRDTDGKMAADQVAGEIRDAGGRAVACFDSVASVEGGQKIVGAALSNFGRIDILVNTAGNFLKKSTLELTEAEFDSLMAVHVKGPFACIKAALPHMVAQRSGRIINFTSRASFVGASSLAYSAAKAAVMGMTSMLSTEQAGNGITVNCISPSAITQLFPSELDKRAKGDNMPRGDVKAGPEFVAPIVAYLATDEAKDVTGKFIYASGGDICLHTHPLKVSSANVFLRKKGKWTVDEIGEVLPTLLGLD
ncbi:MAG: SDR family NAD(P)-dependent oxidoreductase [Chloroflexi bacterium]|nr:SDR family NAD(P)-dependent oxidoreductase [Chloroflexota bacterium]